MTLPSDYGIILEMFGFIVLLLVSGRNPKGETLVTERHQESKFNKIREKIIPDKIVNMFLIIGIGAILIGLSFQFSYLNSETYLETLVFDISGINSISLDSNLATILLAFSAIIGLIITIILHLDSARKDRKIHFNELLEKFSNELSEIRLRENNVDSNVTAIRYARDFIHVMNRLAYLRKLNKIGDDMINFFEASFIQAHTLLNWENTLIPFEGAREDLRYKYAKWWIERNAIVASEFTSLPPQLVEMNDQINSGLVLVHNHGSYDFVKPENTSDDSTEV